MKPKDQEVDWMEVAILLNRSNLLLAEKILKLTDKITKLQEEQYEKMQSPVLLDAKCFNQNN